MSGSSLYLFPQHPLPYPSPSPSPSPVKIEQDDHDSPFIMELTSSSSRSSPNPFIDTHPSAPPTEVPLRATQASKEMRVMMGVFRLNPFAMHSLSRGGDSDDSPDPSPTGSATWSAEAGPLEHEPVMFEFQLHISDAEDDGPVLRPAAPSSRLPAISAHDESQLRAFSPTFELHEGDLSQGTEGPSSSTRYHIQHVLNDLHPIPEKDPSTDFRQALSDSWEEADYAPHAGSDSGASSSTTLSVQTPVNEITSSPFDNPSLAHIHDHFSARGPCQEQSQTSPTVEFSSTPLWDPQVPDNYQLHENPGPPPSLNYARRGGIVHPNTSHSYMRLNYPPTSYPRRQYPQPNPQFQQAQTQPNFFLHNISPNHSPSLLHNTRCSPVQESNSPSQELEHSVPQSPSTLSSLSPATPNSLQYSSLNQPQQQHGLYQSQHSNPSHNQPQHHQMPLYSASNPVTPTSMPLRLPISIARSAMRSAAAFSNATSPTSCQSQLPSPSPYNMHSNGRAYRVSRRPQLDERISEHEVYSTPHSPVTEEGYVPSTSMGMPPLMHLQRSSTYAGGQTPHIVTGGAVACSPLHGQTNANNRRWSLPEMSVGAYTSNPAVGHGESFLGHHM